MSPHARFVLPQLGIQKYGFAAVAAPGRAFDLATLFARAERVVAEAKTVLVAYDYAGLAR